MVRENFKISRLFSLCRMLKNRALGNVPHTAIGALMEGWYW